MAYVYILRCQNDCYYTGWTTDLQKRLKKHNSGTGAKYTRAFGPCELVYFESYEDKTEAMKREAQIKQMSRSEKESLMKGVEL